MATVEVFDPKDSTFHLDGTLVAKRCMHSAVLLPDGKVLLVGGLGEEDEPWPLSIERYDPTTRRSEVIGQLPKGAAHAPTVLLTDGTVFIAALGYGPDFAARFDPRTRKVTVIGGPSAMPMSDASAVRLASGEVLVTGWGRTHGSNAFLFDPSTNRLSATGRMRQDRFGHLSILLKDGRVLVAGGHQARTCEIYDPKSGAFTSVGDLRASISRPFAALLPDGRVLIVGEQEGGAMRNEAYIFDPSTGALKEIAPPDGFFLMAGLLKRENGDVWLVSDTGTIAKYNARKSAWN